MKALVLAALISLTFVAHSSLAVGAQNTVNAKKGGKKSEPAPKDRDERKGGGEEPSSREETYEGNDRSNGGDFDGGGYSEDGGGYNLEVSSETSLVRGGKTYPVTRNLRTEDRGDVIVYTVTEHEDISADETCTTITTTVVEKATKKVLKTDTKEFCNRWPL